MSQKTGTYPVVAEDEDFLVFEFGLPGKDGGERGKDLGLLRLARLPASNEGVELSRHIAQLRPQLTDPADLRAR